MLRSELDYHLPPELIAQHPCTPRDNARLLLVDRRTGRIEPRIFHEIPTLVSRNDCLVVNDTRVIPARFFCRRATGGRTEALFIRLDDSGLWRLLFRPAGRLHPGEHLSIEPPSSHDANHSSTLLAPPSSPLSQPPTPSLSSPPTPSPAAPNVVLELIASIDRGEWSARPIPDIAPLDLLQRVGHTPLPPYISREIAPSPADRADYQTVYAQRPGAIAAPTAGLHFTPELLTRLDAAGVSRTSVTLHVGPGTFLPIDADDLAHHDIHAEWFEVTTHAAHAIAAARDNRGRIIAVGTTSARVLETFGPDPISPRSGWTKCFIFPPYHFNHVDALLTNFHLPQSTLLALVMAFAGIDLTRRAYAFAVSQRFRFYSFGDAMLIL